MTLLPDGRLTLALAVDDASVPASAALFTTVGKRTPSVTAVSCTSVPTGTFEAARLTVSGLGVAGSTITSALSKKVPNALVGVATPLTEAILILGKVSGPGTPLE